MKVDILGTGYEIKYASQEEDPLLRDCDGYCDWTTKVLVVDRCRDGDLGSMGRYRKKVLRHEIVHAFLMESGLHECAGRAEAWAACEEMVDWIARQGQKIFEAWARAGAVDLASDLPGPVDSM